MDVSCYGKEPDTPGGIIPAWTSVPPCLATTTLTRISHARSAETSASLGSV